MKKLITMAMLLFAGAGFSTVAWSTIGPGHHVNIVSFQQDDDFKGTVDYPESIKGKMGDIMTIFDGKAEPYLMIHSPHIHPKDMINAQIDALGERGNGSLEDDGLNCDFVFDQQGDGFTLAGVCHVITAKKTANSEQKVILKAQVIPHDGKHETPTWKKLYSDTKSGVAIYANIEPVH